MSQLAPLSATSDEISAMMLKAVGERLALERRVQEQHNQIDKDKDKVKLTKEDNVKEFGVTIEWVQT